MSVISTIQSETIRLPARVPKRSCSLTKVLLATLAAVASVLVFPDRGFNPEPRCIWTPSPNPPIPRQSYPVNLEAANTLIQSQCGQTARQVLQTLVDNIDHVTHTQFETQLKKSIDDFNNKLAALPAHEQNYVIGIAESDRSSSIQWVTELALPHLKIPPQALIKLEHGCSLEKASRIVLLDDAIYSGTQMSHALHFLGSVKKSTTSIHLIVPFMTPRNLVTTQTQFPLDIASHQLMRTVKDFLPLNLRDAFERMYYPKAVNFDPFWENLTITYFDHKMADFVSTVHRFLWGDPGEVIDSEEDEASCAKRQQNRLLSTKMIPYIRPPYRPY